MAKKRSSDTKKIQNRRARFDYALEDELMAGIVLNGKETKSLRLGNGSLQGAYATVKDGELWLMNATVSGFGGVDIPESEQTHARKLLVKKREIDQIAEAKKQGRTVVPLEILTGGRYIKVKIAIGKGKKHYDKRQALKKRDEQRQIQTMIKRK
jgi:SsrA-binding protein